MRTGTELRDAIVSVFTYRGPSHLGDGQPPVDRPWTITAKGDEWAIAMDGHVAFVARRSLLGDVETCAASSRIGDAVARWLGLAYDLKLIVPVEQFRRFAGEPYAAQECRQCDGTTKVACDDCNGTGRDEHECSKCWEMHEAQCSTCDGTTRKSCDACESSRADRIGGVFGCPVNRVLVAKVLDVANEPDGARLRIGEVDLSVPKTRPGYGRCVRIEPDVDAPDWFAFVMAMAPHVTPEVVYERPETWTTKTAVAS